MGTQSLANRLLVGVSVGALVIGCVGSTSPNSTTSSAPVASVSAPAVSVAGPASPSAAASSPLPSASEARSQSPSAAIPPPPSGWTSVNSPWLGYSIALPATGWEFYDHVAASGSQKPYDMYKGTASGSDADMMLAIACEPIPAGATPPAIREDLRADGVPFIVQSTAGDQPGPTTLIAVGVKADWACNLMADTSNDAATRSFFHQVVASFRFPAPGFVEPSPSASPS